MKTTEMFIEQILIGGTLFLIILLLFPEMVIKWEPTGAFYSVLFGTTALGAAYLLGMVYDRFADTLLEDQEQRARLKRALKRHELGKASSEDLFPVAMYQIIVLSAGEGVTERETYLRSRIRLLRAVTTLLPALAISFSIWQFWDHNSSDFYVIRKMGILSFILIYFGVFLLKVLKFCHNPPNTFPEEYQTPQDHIQAIIVHLNIKKVTKNLKINWSWRDPVFTGLTLLIIIIALLQARIHGILFLLLPIITLAGTFLTGWCFMRVQKTYYHFLDNYHDHWKKEESLTTSI